MPLDTTPWIDPEAEALDADEEILERAAQLLEQDGWCPLEFGISGRCMMRAVAEAAAVSDRAGGGLQYHLLNGWARKLGFQSALQAAMWSDSRLDGTPVIARLRAAARGEL